MAVPLLLTALDAPAGARPRRRWVTSVVAPVLLAAAVGLGVGAAPHTALLVAGGVLSVALLLPRLDLAALAVVSTAVFAEQLDRVHPLAWEWLVAVLLLAWVVRRAAGPLSQRRPTSVLVPAGLLLVVLVLATVAHPNGVLGLAVAGRYLAATGVLLVLTDTLLGPLAPVRAARAYVVSCLLAAAWAVVGVVVEAVAPAARGTVVGVLTGGPLADPDQLAWYLLGALPLVVTLVRRPAAGTPARPRRAWAAGVVLLAGLVTTESRVALVAVVVVLLLAVAIRALAVRWAGLLLLGTATAAAFLLAVVPHPVGQAVDAERQQVRTSLAERVDLWRTAAVMTAAEPALGLGPGAFDLRGPDLRPDGATVPLPGDDDRGPTAAEATARSTLLQATAELGVVGGLLLYAVALAPLAGLARRWVRTGRSPRDRSPLDAAAALALSGVLAVSGTESEQFLLPFWFLSALAAALLHRPRRPALSVLAWAPSDRRTSGQPAAGS